MNVPNDRRARLRRFSSRSFRNLPRGVLCVLSRRSARLCFSAAFDAGKHGFGAVSGCEFDDQHRGHDQGSADGDPPGERLAAESYGEEPTEDRLECHDQRCPSGFEP